MSRPSLCCFAFFVLLPLAFGTLREKTHLETTRYSEAYQVVYERKVQRKDGKVSETMSFQSRPDVKVWDASPEDQEKFRARAFDLAWQHVERAPVEEKSSPFGRGIIYRRVKGEGFWYHGRITNGYKFTVHAQGPAAKKRV